MEGKIMKQDKSLSITGGEALARMLSLYQAKYMFGIGGFQLLPFYNAIAESGNASPKHILMNDERSGAFAADAFARVSGRPGLCDGTMGPGATNLTTGIIESYTAGIPTIAVIGDSNRNHSLKNMTQETRQREVLTPVVKEFIQVEMGHRIPEFIRRAFIAATAGKPGPVIVSVPENVCHGVWLYDKDDFYINEYSLSAPAYRTRPDPEQVKEAAALISRSERPIILVGGGIHLSGAHEELRQFAEELNIPVGHTLSGKGALACSDDLCVGLFGRYDRIANDLIGKSDLIVSVGFKFGEIATNRYSLIPPSVDLIDIDITPEEIGKHQKVSVALWSDCKLALESLIQEMAEDARVQNRKRQPYIDEIKELKKEWFEVNQSKLKSDETPLTMGRVCYELTRAMPKKGILLADGGFAAHWTGLLYDAPTAGRTFVANRGNASIGYGAPGGIGAQLGAGDSPVVAVTGDGGFNMSLGELETAIRECIPVTYLIVNNAASGYVKALQHGMYRRYQSSELKEMDYARIAKAMGANGKRVKKPGDLAGVLRESIAETTYPTVIDVLTTRDPDGMLPAKDARTQER